MDDWDKAGKISAQILNFGKKLIKVDSNVLEVVEKIESEIKKTEGLPAFPVQVSMNEMAAHFTPNDENDLKFKDGDLVKLDVGVHVNGFIGDNALTVDLGENKELSKASEMALKEAIKLAKPGVRYIRLERLLKKQFLSLDLSQLKIYPGMGLSNMNLILD